MIEEYMFPVTWLQSGGLPAQNDADLVGSSSIGSSSLIMDSVSKVTPEIWGWTCRLVELDLDEGVGIYSIDATPAFHARLKTFLISHGYEANNFMEVLDTAIAGIRGRYNMKSVSTFDPGYITSRISQERKPPSLGGTSRRLERNPRSR